MRIDACCGGFYTILEDYTFKNNITTLKNRIIKMNPIIIPKNKLDLNYTSTSDEIKLHYNPYKDKSPEPDDDDFIGLKNENIHSIFKGKVTGKIIDEQKDAEGNIWLLILTDSQFIPTETILPTFEDHIIPQLLGWVIKK